VTKYKRSSLIYFHCGSTYRSENKERERRRTFGQKERGRRKKCVLHLCALIGQWFVTWLRQDFEMLFLASSSSTWMVLIVEKLSPMGISIRHNWWDLIIFLCYYLYNPSLWWWIRWIDLYPLVKRGYNFVILLFELVKELEWTTIS